jgi:hypothetical protein
MKFQMNWDTGKSALAAARHRPKLWRCQLFGNDLVSGLKLILLHRNARIWTHMHLSESHARFEEAGGLPIRSFCMAQTPFPSAPLVLRHNERTKFVAGMLDKLALAVAGTGYIVPVIAGTLPGNVHSAVTLVWLVFGVILWILAYTVLGRLL